MTEERDNIITVREGGTFTVIAGKRSGQNFGRIPYTIQPLTYTEAERRGLNLVMLFPRLSRVAPARAMGM